MDLSKYNMVPTEPATAAEIGLAAATLSAMARRGLVEVLPGRPNKYRRIDNHSVGLYEIIEQHKDCEFFTLFKTGKELGMLCFVSKGDIVDCWGEKYDLTDVNRILIGKEDYCYVEGWKK
jgi:hypothetical protein